MYKGRRTVSQENDYYPMKGYVHHHETPVVWMPLHVVGIVKCLSCVLIYRHVVSSLVVKIALQSTVESLKFLEGIFLKQKFLCSNLVFPAAVLTGRGGRARTEGGGRHTRKTCTSHQ